MDVHLLISQLCQKQYPSYAKNKREGNSQLNKSVPKELQTPSVGSSSALKQSSSDHTAKVQLSPQKLLSQNPHPAAVPQQARKQIPAQTGAKKQRSKTKEKRFAELGGKKVQIYQLRGKEVVQVDDFPFHIPSDLKLYLLRTKSVILLSDAQAIAQHSIAAKEVKKAA